MKRSIENIQSVYDSVIAAEREALLTGSFEMLPRIAEKKSELLNYLIRHSDSENQEWLSQARRRAAENHALYSSALKGIKTVQARVDALLNGGAELKTYSSKGQRAALLSAEGSLQHRA